MAETSLDVLSSTNHSHTPQSPTTQQLLLRANAAAKRRRQRLLSAGDNGAIVEYDHINAPVTPGDPPMRRIPLPPRQVMTRRRLIDCYRKGALCARQRFAFRRASRDEYNYNWFVPAEFNKESDETTLCSKKLNRLRNALLVARLPLSALSENTRGVFDSGHISSPIRRLLQRHANNSSAEPLLPIANSTTGTGGAADLFDEEIAEDTVFLIRPVTSEIPSRTQAAQEESLRVAPKGREWDRQHALRHGVGPTAQEALIDCQMDPRYRKPGDYVRRNGRGEVVDARGRPMRAFAAPKLQSDSSTTA